MPRINRDQMRMQSLNTRESKTDLANFVKPDLQFCRETKCQLTDAANNEVNNLVASMLAANQTRRPVILMMGAHAIKEGLSQYIIDMMRLGLVSHVALNGAALVHEFELFFYGHTSECVAATLPTGQFGMWYETTMLNTLVQQNAECGGLGTAFGLSLQRAAQHWSESAAIDAEFVKSCSIAYNAARLEIPLTVHITVGADVNHMYPNFDAAIWGRLSHADFLKFADSVSDLEDGVFINMGSATTGPELFQKALSMSRAAHTARLPQVFQTFVVDKVELPTDWRESEPVSDSSLYFYRPWKTLLSRAVSHDAATAHYIQGDLSEVLPCWWSRFQEPMKSHVRTVNERSAV